MFIKSVSIAGYLFMVAAMLILFGYNSLVGGDPVSLGVQILAFALMVWARSTMGKRSFHLAGNPTKGALVTDGPYRYIRHPIYAAVLYFLWAGVLSHLSIMAVIVGMLAVVGVAMRIGVEEAFLVKEYPEYRDYAQRTKRVIPFIL
jgi:protein-S-isoprenylcysteine O-methyltransferase Ste14